MHRECSIAKNKRFLGVLQNSGVRLGTFPGLFPRELPKSKPTAKFRNSPRSARPLARSPRCTLVKCKVIWGPQSLIQKGECLVHQPLAQFPQPSPGSCSVRQSLVFGQLQVHTNCPGSSGLSVSFYLVFCRVTLHVGFVMKPSGDTS